MKKLLILSIAALLATAAVTHADPFARKDLAEFVQIKSRIFDAARYDASSHTLTIVFSTGAAYAYTEVPREVYLDFIRIVNKGEYFSRRIRNSYACQRIDRYPSTWAYRD
ncbi:MAG: KTSC domain-containing protein [Kiritimatiellae bacterium]|nr:KTSC domain-containing protein [Kiritimatiellia bacterium]